MECAEREPKPRRPRWDCGRPDRYSQQPFPFEIRSRREGGIPWTCVLSPDGKLLITSDAATGNIGYPTEPRDQAHWELMLRTGTTRLTDSDVQQLMASLMAPPKPFAEAIPSRQVSDPGQVVTSVIVPAPRSASASSPKATKRSQRFSSRTHGR